jgi:hypothetical protein
MLTRKQVFLKLAVANKARNQGDKVNTFNELTLVRITGNPLNRFFCQSMCLKVLITKDDRLSFISFLQEANIFYMPLGSD